MKKTFFALALSLLMIAGGFAQGQKQAKTTRKSANVAHKMDHSKMKMDGKSGNMKGMDHSKMKMKKDS